MNSTNAADTLNVTGSGAASTTLNTFDGDDYISVPSWAGPANSLSVDGGNGTDTLDLRGNPNQSGVLATVTNVENILT